MSTGRVDHEVAGAAVPRPADRRPTSGGVGSFWPHRFERLRARGESRAATVAGVLFTVPWLVWMLEPIIYAWRLNSAWGWTMVVLLVGFCGLYLYAMRALIRRGWGHEAPLRPRSVAILALMVAITGLAVAVLGSRGTTALVYIGAVLVLSVRLSVSVPLGVAGTVVLFAVSQYVPGWHDAQGAAVGLAITVVFGTLAVLGSRRAAEAEALRADRARLAIEDERNRMARDVHDILGHSLTVVTMKTELARRLVRLDPDRAEHELDDIERISRSALADVRRVVAGTRSVSLAGELVLARDALDVGGVHAELPATVDDVDPRYQDLFAWVVREATTNVLRHARARHCRITLGPRWIEVEDDGRGMSPRRDESGNGLRGMRQRAERVGATVTVTAAHPHGLRLRVAADDTITSDSDSDPDLGSDSGATSDSDLGSDSAAWNRGSDDSAPAPAPGSDAALGAEQ